MDKKVIQSGLQIVAVITVFAGAIMTSKAILAMGLKSSIFSQMNFGASGMGQHTAGLLVYGVLAAAMPMLWGAALYSASNKIATHIHDRQGS